MAQLSTRVVTTLAEFEALAQPWNALLRRTTADNLFLTWEWMYSWAKHYLGGRRLRIILVYEGRDRLVGIAPFYLRHVTRYGIFRLRELRFLATEGVGSTYLDFISPKPKKKAVLHHIYQFLHRAMAGLWDTLTLSEIPAESSTVDFWNQLNRESGKVAEIADTTACPLIKLDGGLDAFVERLSRNERYNLRRKRKRLEGFGSVSFERASSGDDVEKALDSFIELHRMRWAQRAPGGTFGSDRFLAFHRDIVKLLASQGLIRLDFLRLNGEAIAGIYGYSYNDRYIFYLPGFNPTVCPNASPGILLLFHCVKEAIAEGHHEFDLLRGIADYKVAWANGLQRSLTVRHYNRHLRSMAMRFLQRGKESIKVFVR